MKLRNYITAAMCVACLLSTMAAPVVHAEDTVLPSGLTVDEFRQVLEEEEPKLEGKFSSAEVGIFQGDTILYTGYFGETDLTAHTPADENTVYEWGSISKTFVWVSVLQLWEEGKLDLEEDIRHYLPEGYLQHLSYDDPITMLHLMNHNAGWCENTYSISCKDAADVRPLAEALRDTEPAQIHRPGEVSAYSNWGAALAGYIVECVSGMDYCDYVHEHILAPLGMEHTAVNPTHSDNPWVQQQRETLHSYQFSAIGTKSDLGTCLEYIEGYPAGAATGTLADLMTYGQAFVNPEAPLFKSPETLELLFSGSDFYGTSDIPVCCYGFWPTEYSIRVYGHSGATHACSADLIFDPETGFGMALLVNEYGGNWYLNNAASLAFGTLSDSKYASGIAETFTPEGYYLPTRSYYRGMMKFIGYLNGSKMDDIGEFERIGADVCQITQDGAAVLLAETTYPDGKHGFALSSMEYIKDDFYLGKLVLLTAYVVVGVIALYFLRLQRKLRKAKRWTPHKGEGILTAGHAAQVVSILALLAAAVVFSLFSGLRQTEAIIIGVIQMCCIAVCLAAAVTAVVLVCTQKGKVLRLHYGLATAGNLLAVGAMVYFEMYQFWAC